MITSDEDKDHQEEKLIVNSFIERRKLREQQNVKGTNIYGGELCCCPNCGLSHWKPREENERIADESIRQ